MDRVTDSVEPGAIDEALGDAERFTVYLVRFRLSNTTGDPVTVDPRLVIRAAGAETPAMVPPVDPVDGEPFYVASDDGKKYRVRTVKIAVGNLRPVPDAGPSTTLVEGASHRGVNPGEPLRLPANSETDLEFAIRATGDAPWLGTYEFALQDGARSLDGQAARVTMMAEPPPDLTPGQRKGRKVGKPVRYTLDVAARIRADREEAATRVFLGPLGGGTSPHMAYTLTTDACATCHSTHTARSLMLLREAAPQSVQCFTCHDGTDADSNIKSQYTDPTVPANDPGTARYFSHAANAVSNHADDRADEFGGVLNRHVACADCHQPHNADATLSTHTASGWTASGALMGASSVAVANGGAGAVPTYTLKDGSDFEYQLCFKCHSGWTVLPARDPAHPSRWAIDKAIELNPANLSFHPVEAQGTNQTARMGNSLAGTSPYKIWTFATTSTIRCVNCHGDSRLALSTPAAGARLAPHAVRNDSMLIANYRTGDLITGVAGSGLKTDIESYDALDHALCMACHAEEPFTDDSGSSRLTSNFRYHGLHTMGLQGSAGGPSLDIDVDGAGQGNALCAECHFRTHGTTDVVDGQPATARLVNFSPNVQPFGGVLQWSGPALKGCTLTCHGKDHANLRY